MKHVTIYTDGSCSGNPGPGGWAAVLIFDEKDAVGRQKTEQLAEGERRTTNNRMELTGAIEALRALEGPHHVRLHTDSAYVSRAFNDGWLKNWQKNGWKTSSKKPVKNKALWQDLLALSEQHEVEWIWVKGHAENELNNLADRLAVEAMGTYK